MAASDKDLTHDCEVVLHASWLCGCSMQIVTHRCCFGAQCKQQNTQTTTQRQAETVHSRSNSQNNNSKTCSMTFTSHVRICPVHLVLMFHHFPVHRVLICHMVFFTPGVRVSYVSCPSHVDVSDCFCPHRGDFSCLSTYTWCRCVTFILFT